MKARRGARRRVGAWGAFGPCGLAALAACSTAALQPSAELDAAIDGEPGSIGAESGGEAASASGAFDGGGPVEGDGCSNTQSDPGNCGSCGHDCVGAPCVAGACGPGGAPFVLASSESPTWMAVDATNVYWMNREPTPPGAGGSAVLRKCAVGGCNGSPSSLWSGLYGVEGLASSGTTLFWATGPGPAGADASFGGSPEVMGCPVLGCGSLATAVATIDENITSFAVDVTHAYWTAATLVHECLLTGCGDNPVTLASGQNYSNDIATNGTDVFWSTSNASGDQIVTCPVGGCSGTPAVVVSGRIGISMIAADAARVYWVELGMAVGGGKVPLRSYTNGRIEECAVTGCGNAPSTLVSYPTWLAAGAIAVDGTDVYWSMEDAGGTWGAIAKCAIGGCGGSPTSVGSTATLKSPTVGLALDATRVYWSDLGSGQVLAVAK